MKICILRKFLTLLSLQAVKWEPGNLVLTASNWGSKFQLFIYHIVGEGSGGTSGAHTLISVCVCVCIVRSCVCVCVF